MQRRKPRRFTNWARTASCEAAHFSTPRSEDELVAAIREASASGERIKLVGAGHSWSDCACTPGHLISLDALSGVLSVDRERGEARVLAGTRLAQLNDALHAQGMALGVLGSIVQQSVAGAISTGTHGSSPKRGNLASLVKRLRIALADGSVVECSHEEDPDLFAAARVGFGALGVITEATIACEPAYRLEEHAEPTSFDAAVQSIPRLVANEEYVKVWWLPHTEHAQVIRYTRTEAEGALGRASRWMDEKIVNRGVFAAMLWLTKFAPKTIPPMNRMVRRAYFKASRRVARSDHALTLAMPPRHEEIEIALPIERAAEALQRTRALIERERLHVNFIVELRFVAADDAWLSPCHGRDSCFIGAYMARSRGIEKYFSSFESEMLALGGRPHWGKQFSAGADALRPLYPRWDDFARLRARLDPRGMFENEYVQRLFGPPAASGRAPAAAAERETA